MSELAKLMTTAVLCCSIFPRMADGQADNIAALSTDQLLAEVALLEEAGHSFEFEDVGTILNLLAPLAHMGQCNEFSREQTEDFLRETVAAAMREDISGYVTSSVSPIQEDFWLSLSEMSCDARPAHWDDPTAWLVALQEALEVENAIAVRKAELIDRLKASTDQSAEIRAFLGGALEADGSSDE